MPPIEAYRLSLDDRYTKIKAAGTEALRRDGITPPVIPVLEDPRRALSLYYDLPSEARDAINEQILEPARRLFKDLKTPQVVFEKRWPHVLVLTMMAAEIKPAFDPKKDDVEPYREIAQEILATHRPFDVLFSRLVPFPGGILLGGFPNTLEVDEIRNQLREQLVSRNLRWFERQPPLKIFHATLARWQTAVEPERARQVLEFISTLDGSDIWKGEINTVTLAIDGYNTSPENTQVIGTFTLKD